MNDLISRKTLLESIKKSYIFDGEFKNIFTELVKIQPTAYDVKKVAEEIKAASYETDEFCDKTQRFNLRMIDEESAIEIIMEGAVKDE